MKNLNLTASRTALSFVVIIVGGCFIWWYQNRPSYLLYQAHRELNSGNQAGVIAEYKRMLSRPGLSKEDEIRYRKALGEFYVRALQESHGVSLYHREVYQVENPFVTDAKKEFKRVLELEPKDGLAHYYLGRILWMQHLESFAMEELSLSRTYDPKNAASLWFLSLTHLDRGDASKARELALQALAIDPDYDQARLALVEAYAALGDHENALKEFDRLSTSFKDNPDIQSRHALYLAAQNDWDEAMRLIEEAVKEAPDNGGIKIDYGRLLLERGMQEEAAGQLAQASALMPHAVEPVVWLAKASWVRGECEEATRLSQILEEHLPRWGVTHLTRAWNHLCKGDAALALADVEEANRLSSDLMEAKELQAQVLLDQEQFKELGRVIRPLLDQKKNESQAYAFLSQSLYSQGNFLMAAEMAETAVKHNLQNATALVWLGMSRARLKDEEGARRAFENAVSLRSFDALIKGYQAYALILMGPAPGVSDTLRTLLKTNPRSAKLWLLLAEVYHGQKSWTQAVDAYQNALAIEPWLARGQRGLKEALEWRDKTRSAR